MGTRPVTLCTAQWADLPFDELCVLAKKMGYDGLESGLLGPAASTSTRRFPTTVTSPGSRKISKKNGLVMKAMACHIIGQCVGDLPDPRLDNFAPPTLAGQPEAIQKWAVETMKKAPRRRRQIRREDHHRLHRLPHLALPLLLPADP